MKSPPELREWIVHKRMNTAGVGDDDPTTAAAAESEAPPPPPEPPAQGDLF